MYMRMVLLPLHTALFSFRLYVAWFVMKDQARYDRHCTIYDATMQVLYTKMTSQYRAPPLCSVSR